jgi:hypothetical protein
MINYLMIVFLLSLGTVIGIGVLIIFINLIWLIESGEID